MALNEKFHFRTYITPNIELRTASNSWENSMPTGSPITNAKMPIKVSPKEITERINHIAQRLQISDTLKKFPFQVSMVDIQFNKVVFPEPDATMILTNSMLHTKANLI